MPTTTSLTPPRDYPEVQEARTRLAEIRRRVIQLERELSETMLRKRSTGALAERAARLLEGQSVPERPVAEIERDLEAMRLAEIEVAGELSAVYEEATSSFRAEIRSHLDPIHSRARKILRPMADLEREVADLWKAARAGGISDADPVAGDLCRIIRVMDTARGRDLVG